MHRALSLVGLVLAIIGAASGGGLTSDVYKTSGQSAHKALGILAVVAAALQVSFQYIHHMHLWESRFMYSKSPFQQRQHSNLWRSLHSGCLMTAVHPADQLLVSQRLLTWQMHLLHEAVSRWTLSFDLIRGSFHSLPICLLCLLTTSYQMTVCHD